MHEEVSRLRCDGVRFEDEWLRRISPAHYGHINVRGTMRFGIERHAQALLDSSVTASSKARSA